jgi:hypothetical protein
MSSKIEVSRELLERILRAGMWPKEAEELRTLLAAPVVERQPMPIYQVRYLGDGGAGWSDVEKDELDPLKSRKDYHTRTVFDAPPELAELQATIARLTAENERLKEAHEQVCTNYNKVSYASEERGKEIERLRGGQGDPVATVRGVIERRISAFDIVIHDSGALHIGTKLYTSQPAPVSEGYKLVPLRPTPAMVEAGINTLCGDDEHQDYRDVYAAMIGAAP